MKKLISLCLTFCIMTGCLAVYLFAYLLSEKIIAVEV